MAENGVAAVERALKIMESFEDDAAKLSLADLANKTGLYRSTILRISNSLIKGGYLHRSDDGIFSLGPMLWKLGAIYARSLDIADIIRPALQRIVDQTGDTAAFYIRRGDQRICLFRHHSARPLRFHVEEGGMLPLDRKGAATQVLIAYTDHTRPEHEKVRADGFYLSVGEVFPETGGAFVPVFGAGGEFIGAIGIAGLKDRFSDENRSQLENVLKAEARVISGQLSGRSH